MTASPRPASPTRRLAMSFGPLGRRLAGTRWFPLWAILRHTGRRSGTRYAIPIVALPTTDGFAIPLPFGEATQWVQNLVAAGGGGIRWRGREFHVEEPAITTREALTGELPRVVVAASRRFGIEHFVRVRTAPED